jgi:TonB family protein
MEVPAQVYDRAEGELRLLPQWHSRDDASRWEVAGIVSVGLHLAGIVMLVLLPVSDNPRSRLNIADNLARSTPLIAPPQELTQTAPNRGKVGKEFTLDSLLPKPRIFIPPTSRSTTLPPPAPYPSSALPEPPKINPPQTLAQLPPAPGAPLPPPPQIQEQEKPKIVLETPGVPAGTGTSTGQPKLKVPSSSVDEAARAVTRGRASGGGGVVVGDLDVGWGGIGEGINLPPSPGKTASTLELLSDPMGVDFHPYLIRILATVKRNWWAVIPESAKLGRQGRVVIVFIDRNGSVPKLVIARPSGTIALDRAAVAGISASNPFPPLPTDFKGGQIRLQFTFLYNVRPN